jgi:hypothetical protein
MHKGHYSDSYCVLARFLGRFARSNAAISCGYRVSMKVIIDLWTDHLTDHLLRRNPKRWSTYIGLYTHEVGCPSDMYYERYGARPNLKVKGLG